MGNPQAQAASNLQSQISRLMGDQSFNVTPMSLAEMNEITRRQLIGDRSRALSQAGGLNTARGYSLGLTNPFGLAQRAEASVYDKYAGALQGITGSNIDRAYQQLFQSRNARFGRLAQLLGLQAGNIGNMSSGLWNETLGPLLGAGIGAFGSIYGGSLAGKAGQTMKGM